MEQADIQTLIRFFKILANESRLKLIGILSHKECSVEELAALLQLKEPTISHHLAKLKDLDLVQMRPVGNTHLYQLNHEALQALNKAILTPEQIISLTNQVDENGWENKVLSNFLEGDRLKEIPATRKKRLVILKWLVKKFDPAVTYPEKVVNETIKHHHPDCATIRREFIGYQLMQRENGLYWRLPETAWIAE